MKVSVNKHKTVTIIALSLALAGCQTTQLSPKTQARIAKACAYRAPAAVANDVIGSLLGPLGITGAQVINAGEAAGCTATGH